MAGLFDESDFSDTEHDFSEARADIAVNYEEFELPIGKLRFDLDDIKINGKSLSELKEDSKRVGDIPTDFMVGMEAFNIHHRRYKDGDGNLSPKSAASDFSTIVASMISNPTILNTLNEINASSNVELPTTQAFCTMLIGIANIFYRGAGFRMLVGPRVMDPQSILAFNKSIMSGTIDPLTDRSFAALDHVEELDATTSMALDVFLGRALRDPQQGGTLDSELTKLGNHISALMALLLDSCRDAVEMQALLSVLDEPKWEKDPIALSSYLAEIDFHTRLDERRGRLVTRMGSLSNGIVKSLAEMSLYNTSTQSGPFANGRVAPYLTSSEDLYNLWFSKYIIILATTITGPYPLAGMCGNVPAKVPMITYEESKILYESKVTDSELTPEYEEQRRKARVLHKTLYGFWKDDSAHSRLIRKAIASDSHRHTGEIEIILSKAAGRFSSGPLSVAKYDAREMAYGNYVLKDDISNDDDDLRDQTTNTQTVSKKEHTMENEVKSVYEGSSRATNLRIVEDKPTEAIFGSITTVVPITDSRVMINIGMANLVVPKAEKGEDTRLLEIGTEIEVGIKTEAGVEFHDTPLGNFYNFLAALSPTKTVIMDDGSVLLSRSGDGNINTVGLSSNIVNNDNRLKSFARKQSIKDSTVAMYNAGDYMDMGPKRFLGVKPYIVVEDERIGIDGLDTTEYPASYYTGKQGPLNWLRMLNGTSDHIRVTSDVDFVPSAVLALSRANPEWDGEDAHYISIGNIDILVVPTSVVMDADINQIKFDNFRGGDYVNVPMVAVFGFVDSLNGYQYHVTPVRKDNDGGGKATDEPVIEAAIIEPAVDDVTTAGVELVDDDFGEFGAIVDPGIQLQNHIDTDIHESYPGDLGAIMCDTDTDDDGVIVIPESDKMRLEEAMGDIEQHQMEMEDIISAAMDEELANAETQTIDYEKEPQGLAAYGDDIIDPAAELDHETIADNSFTGEEESTEVVRGTPLSVAGARIRSYFLEHGCELYPKEEAVKEAHDAGADTANLEYNRTVTLRRDCATKEQLDKSINHHLVGGVLKNIEHEIIDLDGWDVVRLRSDAEDAAEAIEAISNADISALSGVDTTKGEGHNWLIGTRYNPIRQAIVLHIMDEYENESENPVALNTSDVEGERMSYFEAMDAYEELEDVDLGHVYTGVLFDDSSELHDEVDDLEVSTLTNLERSVAAEVAATNKAAEESEDELESGYVIRVIELARAIHDCKALGRTMRRRVSSSLLNRIVTICSKYHLTAIPNFRMTVDHVGALINEVHQTICHQYGIAVGHAMMSEIDELTLDTSAVNIVFLDITAAELGLIDNFSNCPASEIGIDMNMDNELPTYVSTSDEVLLKYDEKGPYNPILHRVFV